MSNRDTRRQLVDVTVWTACALAIVGSFIVVRQTDREHAERTERASEAPLPTTVEAPEEHRTTTDRDRLPDIRPAPRPPTRRLEPVRRTVRRRIVIRRSRPS